MTKRKLPDRPQWYRDMIATLRAERKRKDIEPHEFAELAADQIEDHPDFMRFLARTDATAYDRLIGNEQKVKEEEEAALAEATGYLEPSMLTAEMLERLGLDPLLELGFGRKVSVFTATPEQRQQAIMQLETKLKNSNGIRQRITDLQRVDELAGDKTLREVIDNRPDEYGTGTL